MGLFFEKERKKRIHSYRKSISSAVFVNGYMIKSHWLNVKDGKSMFCQIYNGRFIYN